MSFAKINIKVHPVVFRYIDNNFTKIDGGYDIEKSPLYFAITSMLIRSNVQMPSDVGKKYDKFKEISIFISKRDFYNYGHTISQLQQYIFSKFIYNFIINDICTQIMYMHVYGRVTRNKAINTVLLNNLFEEDELNYEYLRKIYQRRFLKKEVKFKN